VIHRFEGDSVRYRDRFVLEGSS